jgi:hypothetical protein
MSTGCAKTGPTLEEAVHRAGLRGRHWQKIEAGR